MNRFFAGTRREVARIAAAQDVRLGYPRTHPESELIRHGKGPHAEVVRTETYALPMKHASLGFAVALAASERGKAAEVDDGAGGTVRVDLPPGGDLPVDERPERDREEWTHLPARDGLAGSTDGIPMR